MGPWWLGCCRGWVLSLACSIFLLKRHWNKMSSSGRVGITKEGVMKGFWEDTAWTKSELAFTGNVNKHIAQEHWRSSAVYTWKRGTIIYRKTKKTLSQKWIILHTLALPEVDFILLEVKGLRGGSSTLTGEEKSEHPRPSELTCIDPSLRVHSLSERIKVTCNWRNETIHHHCSWLFIILSQQKSVGPFLKV